MLGVAGALRPNARPGLALRSEKLLLRACETLGEPKGAVKLPAPSPELLSRDFRSGLVKVTTELFKRWRGGTGGVATGGVPTVPEGLRACFVCCCISILCFNAVISFKAAEPLRTSQ